MKIPRITRKRRIGTFFTILVRTERIMVVLVEGTQNVCYTIKRVTVNERSKRKISLRHVLKRRRRKLHRALPLPLLLHWILLFLPPRLSLHHIGGASVTVRRRMREVGQMRKAATASCLLPLLEFMRYHGVGSEGKVLPIRHRPLGLPPRLPIGPLLAHESRGLMAFPFLLPYHLLRHVRLLA